MAPDTQLTAEQFHAASLSLIDQLTDRCAAYDLSEAPQALLTLRRKLADDDRRVIVVGPAKRGKTTFVNALIGADVLPTGVNVTTNQPFYVRPAETEGYRLRFEDGSATEIRADDLELYGSEVAAEEGRAPELERPLRWIEVDVPARFVPAGLVIVDLPGTDALYAAHAEITRRFVPLADAVIFVMDSDQPFGRQEQKLLESLLEVTTRIFFVQTKIDQHGRQAWEQTRARNEQILEQEFGERLNDLRVWPVSSTNLMAVAASDGAEDALLMVSRYRELADALREFLADVCSAPRAVAALILATRHHQATRQVLEDRLQSLTHLSEADAKAHRRSIAARRAEFEDAWGDRGSERGALASGIRRIATISKQELRESLQPNGPIALAMERRIDSITTIDEANRLGETLAADVVAAGIDGWNRICELANRQYAELLEPLLVASENLMPEIDVAGIALPDHEARAARTDDHVYDRVRATFGYSMPMYTAAGLAISLVASPLVIAATAGGVLWAVTRGWKQALTQKTKTAKSELQRQLRLVLQRVSNHFLMVDLESSRYSRADEYFAAVEAAMTERVATIVKRRVQDLRGELARLEAQAQLKAEERETTVTALGKALVEWDAMARQLGRLLSDERSKPHVAALLATSGPARAPGPVRAAAA